MQQERCDYALMTVSEVSEHKRWKKNTSCPQWWLVKQMRGRKQYTGQDVCKGKPDDMPSEYFTFQQPALEESSERQLFQ